MNTEELSESLRTEINTYMKNAVADLQQEIVGIQERMNAEVERVRTEFQTAFDDLLAKGAATTVDDEFARLVAEHVEIAYEDGIKEGKEAADTAHTEAAAVAAAEAAAIAAAAPPVEEIQPVMAQPARADYSIMREAISDVSAQSSQAEILKALVKHSSNFAPRGAFFIVKSDHLVGWRTFGSELESNIDAVREVVLPLSGNTLLGTSIRENASQTGESGESGEDAQYLQKLNFGEPASKIAIPLVVRGRGVAVLYADSGANAAEIDVDALEALVRVSSLTVELLAAAKSPASAATAATAKIQPPTQYQSYKPTVQPPEANIYEPASTAAVETAHEFQPSVRSNGQTETKSFEPNFAPSTEPAQINSAPESYHAPIPRIETTFSFDTAQSAGSNFSSLAGSGAVATAEQVAAEVPAAPTAAPGASRRFGERNLELPIDVPEDERRAHNDARRFARLLVSEIKLYNEQKVREGRQAGDLYIRLREAVDRSREMYDKRVSPPVAAKFDYFNYELVSTLAEGDENKLGNDYPGAAV